MILEIILRDLLGDILRTLSRSNAIARALTSFESLRPRILPDKKKRKIIRKVTLFGIATFTRFVSMAF